MRFIFAVVMVMLAVSYSLAQTGGEAGDEERKKKYIYEWTDTSGHVYITNDLGNVPEQYREKVRRIEDKRGASSSDVFQPYASEPHRAPVHNEEAKKDEWQRRIKDWQNRLSGAQRKYQDLERERNLLLGRWGSPVYAPPEDRKRAEEVEQEMIHVRREIDNANNMLENVIPEEARKAGVPPGWLRE